MVSLSQLKIKKGDEIKFRKLKSPLVVSFLGKNVITLKSVRGGEYSIVQNVESKRFILSSGSKVITSFDGKIFNSQR